MIKLMLFWALTVYYKLKKCYCCFCHFVDSVNIVCIKQNKKKYFFCIYCYHQTKAHKEYINKEITQSVKLGE